MAEPSKKRLLTTDDETNRSANTKKKKQIRRSGRKKTVKKGTCHLCDTFEMQLPLLAIRVAKEHKTEI